MKLFFKRLAVYWLCALIVYLPVPRVQAAFPVAAVVLDVIGTTAAVAGAEYLTTRAICGLSPWAANDPVFACGGKTPKGTWLNNAKGSAKWGALFLAAGYFAYNSGSFSSTPTSAGTCNQSNSSFSACIATITSQTNNYLSQYPDYYSGPLEFIDDGFSYVSITIRQRIKNSNGVNVRTYTAKYVETSTNADSLRMSDNDFYNDFWQTSPDIPPETWLPKPTTAVPNPVHPDPAWFPDVEPKTQPVIPAQPAPGTDPYPKPLPETHPDHRPSTTPQPEYDPSLWPAEIPDYWPSDWPAPGSVPGTSPGEFPEEWPLPGSVPVPGTGTGTDTGTDTGTGIEGLPVPLPVVGPMTLAEFEQAQQRNFAEATNGLPEADFQTPQDQITQAMNDFIADKVTADVPEFSFNPFGYFTFGGGACIEFQYTLSIGGVSRAVTFDAHCPPMENYVRPTLEWFLYLSTALHIYSIFTRTVRSV